MITIRNGVSPEVREETTMTPSPAIIELRQVITCEEIDKLEEIISLCQDKKIVNLIDQAISNVHCMKEDNDPTEDKSKVCKPALHKVLMRLAYFDTVFLIKMIPVCVYIVAIRKI